jgi:hypothetical protein
MVLLLHKCPMTLLLVYIYITLYMQELEELLLDCDSISEVMVLLHKCPPEDQPKVRVHVSWCVCVSVYTYIHRQMCLQRINQRFLCFSSCVCVCVCIHTCIHVVHTFRVCVYVHRYCLNAYVFWQALIIIRSWFCCTPEVMCTYALGKSWSQIHIHTYTYILRGIW